jgi:hypothetical protein
MVDHLDTEVHILTFQENKFFARQPIYWRKIALRLKSKQLKPIVFFLQGGPKKVYDVI